VKVTLKANRVSVERGDAAAISIAVHNGMGIASLRSQ
jgi:hypothetical protein